MACVWTSYRCSTIVIAFRLVFLLKSCGDLFHNKQMLVLLTESIVGGNVLISLFCNEQRDSVRVNPDVYAYGPQCIIYSLITAQNGHYLDDLHLCMACVKIGDLCRRGTAKRGPRGRGLNLKMLKSSNPKTQIHFYAKFHIVMLNIVTSSLYYWPASEALNTKFTVFYIFMFTYDMYIWYLVDNWLL